MPAEKGDILAQRPFRTRVAQCLAAAVALVFLPPLAVVTAFGIAPDAAPVDALVSLERETLEAPATEPATQTPPRFASQERVLRGDTVAALFDRLGVRDAQALEFLRTNAAGRQLFRQLVPGRTIQVETGNSGELLALRYMLGNASLLEVARSPAGLTARQRPVAQETRRFYKSAIIRSSLFA